MSSSSGNLDGETVEVNIAKTSEVFAEHPIGVRLRRSASVCPKDVTMYRDAVKTTGYESKLHVKDLIELVYEAM